MDYQEVANQETEMDENSYCRLLVAALNRTACHVALASKEKSGDQELAVLRKWFSGNDANQN